MRVGILGPLLVDSGTEAVEIGGARLRALLIRLALDAGRTVPVEALASALWPEATLTGPVNAVQTLVSRLRRALPASEVLQSTAGGYRLALPPEAVDAVRFERLARDGRRALAGGDAPAAAQRLREALALWRGDPLVDVAGAPFAAAAAVRLTELRLAAIEDRVAADLAGSPPASLVAELQELVTAHPLRERLRTLLVRALHAAGRQAEALTAYEQFRRLLADELGTDPGAELQQAHLAVLRAEPSRQQPQPQSPPAPPRPDRPRGNLRAELTSFVGRTEERQRVGKQLAEGRLVTLAGPGGAGKTRLATAVAADLAEALPGGVWLVELAPVTDPSEVPQAVIAALGLRETGRPEPAAAAPDPMIRLVDALSATETLLVLDNCEHLLDTAARLAEGLLGDCPQLRILTTSREPLGILGEALCPVPPLGLPRPGASAQEAVLSPAVRLLTDRAAAVRPDFAVTDDNVAAVVEVCRRLDGLPLAIELAAARLRSMTVAQVAARLDDRFRLLTGGSRTALPRHQTLRAVAAWSWDLLEPDEQQAAERLAVFPAAITATAATKVCASAAAGAVAEEPDPAIMDVLAALVDKSLLQPLEGGPEPAFRMLETIREYGLARLAETGELTRARAAHTAYYLRLAEQAAPHLRTGGQLPWIARLRADAGSPAAFHFAHETGDTDTLVRLAAALSYFWTLHGAHEAAVRRLRMVLEAPGEAPPMARAVVAGSYLFNALLAGGDAEAFEVCRRNRDWSDKQPPAAMIEAGLALVDHDTAAGLAATGAQLSNPDPWVRGMLWLLRSWLHGNDGATDEHRHALDAAVAAFRESGERWGLATALTHGAHDQITLGDFEGAIAALAEAIALLRELDPANPALHQRVLLAAARGQQGDRARARAELQELVAPGLGTSSASNLVLARISLGDLARLDGDLAEAARQYQAAEQELARLPFDASLFRATLLCAQGHAAVAGGELAAARWALAEAFARAVEAPDMAVAADIAVAVARLRWRAGVSRPDQQDPLGRWHGGATDTAAEVLGAAHALRGSPDAYDPDVVALADGLRAELGERAFQAAYERGRGLDRGDALTLIHAQVPSGQD